MGTVYRRKNVFWIKYYRNGKPYYESTHSNKKEVAKGFYRDVKVKSQKDSCRGYALTRFDLMSWPRIS